MACQWEGKKRKSNSVMKIYIQRRERSQVSTLQAIYDYHDTICLPNSDQLKQQEDRILKSCREQLGWMSSTSRHTSSLVIQQTPSRERKKMRLKIGIWRELN